MDSTTQPSTRDYEDDDMIASEQDQEFNDEHENVAVQDNGTYFNYQSHMKKTPRGKWTKQDTELFYEVCLHAILIYDSQSILATYIPL